MYDKKLAKKLLAEGWVQTDGSCNQYRKDIDGEDGGKYLFREDRIVDPSTGKTEVYESEIDLDDYDWWQITDACKPFGYSAKQVSEWLDTGEELALIAECLFEMEVA